MKRIRLIGMLLVFGVAVAAAGDLMRTVSAQTAGDQVAGAIQQASQVVPTAVQLASNGKASAAATQAASVLNVAAPVIGQTVDNVRAAGNDPAAIAAAVSAGIAEGARLAAPIAPPPANNYLALANLVGTLLQGFFLLFVHKKSVDALAVSAPAK